MSLADAIRELRLHTGKSQQVFATELEMSISSLQKYEYGDTPAKTAHLLRFWAVAVTAKRPDLAQVIYDGVQEQIVAPPGFVVYFGIEKADGTTKAITAKITRGAK